MYFTTIIEEDAIEDIQEIINWYEKKQKGLGKRFFSAMSAQIETLKIKPEKFQIRYLDVRCLVLAKWPFLIHYNINKDLGLVNIFAVLHTSKNPKIWKNRRLK